MSDGPLCFSSPSLNKHTSHMLFNDFASQYVWVGPVLSVCKHWAEQNDRNNTAAEWLSVRFIHLFQTYYATSVFHKSEKDHPHSTPPLNQASFPDNPLNLRRELLFFKWMLSSSERGERKSLKGWGRHTVKLSTTQILDTEEAQWRVLVHKVCVW